MLIFEVTIPSFGKNTPSYFCRAEKESDVIKMVKPRSGNREVSVKMIAQTDVVAAGLVVPTDADYQFVMDYCWECVQKERAQKEESKSKKKSKRSRAIP